MFRFRNVCISLTLFSVSILLTRKGHRRQARKGISPQKIPKNKINFEKRKCEKFDSFSNPPKNVHPCLLHHGKEVRVIRGPFHVPHILALEFDQVAIIALSTLAGLRGVRCSTSVQVKELQESSRSFMQFLWSVLALPLVNKIHHCRLGPGSRTRRKRGEKNCVK